jgi:hypothetical protein
LLSVDANWYPVRQLRCATDWQRIILARVESVGPTSLQPPLNRQPYAEYVADQEKVPDVACLTGSGYLAPVAGYLVVGCAVPTGSTVRQQCVPRRSNVHLYAKLPVAIGGSDPYRHETCQQVNCRHQSEHACGPYDERVDYSSDYARRALQRTTVSIKARRRNAVYQDFPSSVGQVDCYYSHRSSPFEVA